jgi:hypothetical protein
MIVRSLMSVVDAVRLNLALNDGYCGASECRLLG